MNTISGLIKATAKNGTIISKGDVLSYLATRSSSTGTTAAAAKPAAAAAPLQMSTKPAEVTGDTPYTDIPNSNMRKVIAKRLTQSKQTVPHVYATISTEIDALLKYRSVLKKVNNINVSVNDIVIKAAALALRDVPEANAKWDNTRNAIDNTTSSNQIDISVAVATPNGLITPILTAAHTRGLVDINNTVKDLATRAKDGKLKMEEFQGGSFTISNLGMFGITEFSAVINPPQACILAVGGGVSRVVPPSGEATEPRMATTVTVQLSADRRVIDESIAAQFLQVFSRYLSNPALLAL